MDLQEKKTTIYHLNSYTLAEKIWSTPTGTLYKAIEKHTGKTTAIQMFTPEIAANTDVVEALTHHVHDISSLSHPNIVKTHALQYSDEGFFLILDYFHGTRLDTFLQQRGPLTAQPTVRLLRHLLSGLQHLHENNLLHAGLTPYHIIVDRGNIAKILYPGTSRVINQHLPPTYASSLDPLFNLYQAPELRAAPSRLTKSADLYALGMIAHQMLTGNNPDRHVTASASDTPSINNRMRDLNALSTSPPQALTQTISTALARESIHRFQDVDAMLGALEEVAFEDIKPTVIYQKTSPLQHLPTTAILFILSLVILLGLAFFYWQSRGPNPFLTLQDNAATYPIPGLLETPRATYASDMATLNIDLKPSGTIYLDEELLLHNGSGVHTFLVPKQVYNLLVTHPQYGNRVQQLDFTEQDSVSLTIDMSTPY